MKKQGFAIRIDKKRTDLAVLRKTIKRLMVEKASLFKAISPPFLYKYGINVKIVVL